VGLGEIWFMEKFLMRGGGLVRLVGGVSEINLAFNEGIEKACNAPI
jgi:hypothetical protein